MHESNEQVVLHPLKPSASPKPHVLVVDSVPVLNLSLLSLTSWSPSSPLQADVFYLHETCLIKDTILLQIRHPATTVSRQGLVDAHLAAVR
jgi:hypothetical protein